MTEDKATPEKLKRDLRQIADTADSAFAETHAAREKALRLSRDVIRTSANSIRATHRGEYDQARRLLDTAASLVAEIEAELTPRSSVYYAGLRRGRAEGVRGGDGDAGLYRGDEAARAR